MSTSSLILKPFFGDESLMEMLKIRIGTIKHDKIDINSVLEAIPSISQFKKDIYMNNCVPENDIILAFIDSVCVGYKRIGWWKENDGGWLYLHLGSLLPTYRNLEIEDQLLEWAENRIRVLARTHKSSQFAFFGANATTTDEEETHFLLSHGYKKEFSLCEMGIQNISTITNISLPTGFETRKVKKSHIRPIWEANNAIYASRKFTSVPTEDDFQEFSTNPLNEFDLWTVAWHGNEVAGFVLSRLEKGRAEIFEVSVGKQFQRKGLGSAILNNNIVQIKERGIAEVRLYTSGENIAGAKSLYEKIGFTHLKDFNRYRKPIR